MEGNTIIIRGNITHSINRYEQMAREREEREKAEREARWQKEREERDLKEAEWKNEHPILSKYTYMSYYNYETYSWCGNYCKINFYEWSNINSTPKFFPYTTEFYRFLDKCKINLTDEQNTEIKNNYGCHIMCIPGTHDIIIGKDYEDLKSKLNLSKIIKSNNPSSKSSVPAVIQCVRHDGPVDYA